MTRTLNDIRYDLAEFTIDGFCKVMADFFDDGSLKDNKTVKVIKSANADELNEEIMSKYNGRPPMPLFAIQPTGITENTESIPAWRSRFIGHEGKLDETKQNLWLIRPVPVMFRFRIVFATQNYTDILQLAHHILYYRHTDRHTFDLGFDDEGFLPKYRPKFNADINIPTITRDDTGERFVVDTDAELKGWLANMGKIPIVRTIKHTFKVSAGQTATSKAPFISETAPLSIKGDLQLLNE